MALPANTLIPNNIMNPIMNVTTIILIFIAKNKATAWSPPNPNKYSKLIYRK